MSEPDNAATVTIRAAVLLGSMPEFVASTIDHLGESPEALRGAREVIAMAARLMVTVVGRTTTTSRSDRDMDAEMSGTGLVLTAFLRGVSQRLMELDP